MSWLFGIVGSHLTPDVFSSIKEFVSPPLYSYKSQNLQIFCGGLKETCLSSLANARDTKKPMGWIVCGLGLCAESDDQMRILIDDDWDGIFQRAELQLGNLEGHFVALQWNKNRVTGYVDSRGIRDLYVARFKNYILISTRLDLFAKFGLSCSIDYLRFGSRWLAFNQISTMSIVNPVERLGPGAQIRIENCRYSISRPASLQLPKMNKSMARQIDILTTFPLDAGYQIITCLSGGVDSRLLLATLLSRPKDKWKVCMFGPVNHPDVRIARQIVQDLHLDNIYLPITIPDASQIISAMRNFVVHTQCIAPATEAIRLGFYKSLYEPKTIIIDGAFGEIMRRTYLNRLFIRGRMAFRQGRIKKIMPLLHLKRGDIFNVDVLKIMNNGFEDDVTRLWHILFKSEKIKEFENILDLMAIMTRLPNLFGPEVTRLDHLIVNYMPFAQPSFLSAVLKLKLNLRRNGKFSKTYIKERGNFLNRYRLVKENSIYPFGLSHPVLTKIWKEAGQLFGFSFSDSLQIEILKKLEPFIRDTGVSHDTRSFAAYDMKKIDHLIDKFYRGNFCYAGDLSWWLSFELWRQACMFS